MPLFPITVAGVQIGLIDSNDRFSKDPGPNVYPQAGPNTPVPTTAQEKTVVLVNSPNAGGTVLAAINNPG